MKNQARSISYLNGNIELLITSYSNQLRGNIVCLRENVKLLIISFKNHVRNIAYLNVA